MISSLTMFLVLISVVIGMLVVILVLHIHDRAVLEREHFRISSLDGIGVLNGPTSRDSSFLVDKMSTRVTREELDVSDLKANPIGKKFGKKWSVKKLRRKKHIILFLGADVDQHNAIHVDKDCESIKDVLSGSEVFHVIEKFSVRKNEIIPLIVRYQPSIVHFDGHGTEDGSLAVCSETREFDKITPEELKGVFNTVKAYVLLSYFDACHTAPQAMSAVLSVKAAIGMLGLWPVESARIFSKQFYLSLENELSVKDAFELAKEQLGMEDRKYDKNIPKLYSEVDVNVSELKFKSKTHKER